MNTAIDAFSSLSQETRLSLFKLLVEFGNKGAVAGDLAKELDIPPNTLSFHLSHLSRAGLISSKREGRFITYFANQKRVQELISYLRANCCKRDLSQKGRC